MDMTTTLALAAVALALTVVFGWLGARPPRLMASPRLVPWRFLMLLAFVGTVATLVHAVTLMHGVDGSGPH
jgi:hypothetical protein